MKPYILYIVGIYCGIKYSLLRSIGSMLYKKAIEGRTYNYNTHCWQVAGKPSIPAELLNVFTTTFPVLSEMMAHYKIVMKRNKNE